MKALPKDVASWLLLEPVLLGGRKAIFPSDGRARHLGLVSVQQASTGVLIRA